MAEHGRPLVGGQDLRVLPLALGGWAACWVGTAGRGWWVAAAVLAAALMSCLTATLTARPRAGRGRVAAVLLAVRTHRAWVLATAVTVAVCAVLGALQVHRLDSGPPAALARDRAWVDARAVVRSDAHSYPARGALPALVTVRVEVRELWGRGSGWRVRAPVLLTVSGAAGSAWAGLPVGTTVALAGRLQPAERGDDVAATLQVRGPPQVVAAAGPGLRLVERVRQGLRTSVQHRRPEQRALVPALVLGDTSALTPELQAEFRSTGLTHLTAVSGANLTLLLAFVLLAARWSGVRGWWLRGVGLVGVGVFVALYRTEPSVLRAAAMGLVALAALGSGSRRAGVRSLAVAMVLLLLVDPFLARSWGFALSVLASGGIIWWSRPWADVLSRWAPRVVAEPLTLALAAHLATLPAVAALSGTVSASGLLANALAGPFVGPATVLGFAAAGASLVSSQLAAVLAFGAAWSAQVIIWVAHLGAALPGGSRTWPTTPAALALLAAGCVAAAFVVPWVLARRWLSLLLAVVMTVALARAPALPGWPPADWRFVVCDIGQGDGLVLRAGDHSAVVVDSGPDPQSMRRCLDGLGVRQVPLLVLSHFHADHVDGLTGVFSGRTVDRLWVSPLASPTGEAAGVRGLAAQHGVPVEVPSLDSGTTVGAVTLRVLGPLPPQGADADQSATENDASLVLLAEVDGLRVLLTGDVEPPGQRALIARGTDLRAQVLKIPHHGSSRQETAFFAATGASVAIASAGVDNDYGHPAPKTVALAQSLGMTVLRTDQNGSVAVTWHAGRLGGRHPAPALEGPSPGRADVDGSAPTRGVSGR